MDTKTQVRYVTKRMLVSIHHLAVGLSGGATLGQTNIRDGQNLGFVEQIYANTLFGQTLYPDIFHQAAAYMFYVIKNHTFHDGNKRTGLATAVAFLQWNQVHFLPFEEDKVFDFVMDVAGGSNNPSVAIPHIAQWFKDMSLH